MKRFLTFNESGEFLRIDYYLDPVNLSCHASVSYFIKDIQNWLANAQNGDKLVLDGRYIICIDEKDCNVKRMDI